MTIYKFIKQDKEPEKKLIVGEQPEEPLDEVEVPAQVIYRRQRSKLCLNIFLIFVALLVLAAGIFGGIQLYKHLHRNMYKKWRGTCGFTIQREEPKALPQSAADDQDMKSHNVDFMKDSRHHRRKPGHHKHHHRRPHTTKTPIFDFQKVKEEIEVINEMIERIQVPKFDDIDNTLILHDFERNYSAIVDFDMHTCYVMKLDRRRTAPPKDLIDLIRKINTGYYLPRVDVIRRKYRMMTPAIKDISYLGAYIVHECIGYRTYKLEKMVGDVIEKRSADHPLIKKEYYYLSGETPTGIEIYMK